jgi:dTDP-4-amino-4,6-dideoxygalactose transaminase
MGLPAGSFPLAEELANTVVSLPLGPHLTSAQQDQVLAAVTDVARALART